MAFKHSLVAALALAMVCLQLAESARDQYGNRQDKPHAALPLSEATDPTLQVDGLHSVRKETNADVERVGNSEADRRKRAFSLWNGQPTQLAGYESFSRWKPPVYQLSRPYFIPVYGAPGRTPIYFPPQPLNINPGAPVDNPLPHRPFTGPEYLPPTTSTEKTVTTGIINRFDYDDDEEDARPVWADSPPAASTQRPNSNIVPTRPTRPPGLRDFPPLVHSIRNDGINRLTAESESDAFVQSRPRTTRRPEASGPSNCVWAIVSCCSAASSTVADSCFEQRGCPGPFWGASPCDSEFARSAVSSALNYYSE